MGKKKSTVLMVLLTILMVALCALTAFPSFAIPGTVSIWNPAVMQYDLGADLGGGYYTYYYPTGVISETEYKELDEEDKQSYVQHGGLYLNNDPDYGIIDDSEVDENENGIVDAFEEEFAKAVELVSARYAAKGYSDYRVSVVDDYAIRVQIPEGGDSQNLKGKDDAWHTFSTFANVGGMTITLKGSEISQLEDNALTDLIKGFSVHNQYDTAFIKVEFTKLGKKILDDFAYEVKAAAAAAETSSSSTAEEVTLDFMIGDTTLISLKEDALENGTITTKYEIKYAQAASTEAHYIDTLVILLNSALKNSEGCDLSFETIPSNQVRNYGSVYGKYTQLLLYIAMFALIVALIAFSVVKMGRFGVVGGYATASYLIITGLCFAFITGGVYEITLGTALVFALGLVLVNALHASTYSTIKAEVELGKTLTSAVKNGYDKTIWKTVDVYAVLLLGALALLIGAAGLQTFATQAIICIVTGAFCNLLWTRVINYMFLSASKNKYKYFRIVREDNDDE